MTSCPVLHGAPQSVRLSAPLSVGLVLAAASLAGCAQPLPPFPPASVAGPSAAPSAPMRDSCDPRAAAALVGQQATPQNLQEAGRLAGASVVRRLEPGMMVTKEYRFGRLNVVTGADGRISGMHCG